MTGRRSVAPGVEILCGAEELARRAAAEIVGVLGEALERRSRASWVLAGGSTPHRLYRLLAGRPQALDWRRVELYWGDERCVEPSSAASNYALAHDTLLAGLPFAAEGVHRVRGELAPSEAARHYAREVEAALAAAPFDLVLLGLGADGHVASLFPAALPPAGPLAVAVEVPSRPRWRVTLTPAALRRSRRLIYLVRGRDKAAAVAQALDPGRKAGQITDRVRPAAGETLWLLDRGAAGELAGGPSGPCGSLAAP